MPKYMFVPTFNFNDPEQCSEDLEKVKRLADEFLRKYGGPDCLSLTVVEVKPVGTLEFVSPIWHEDNGR